MFIMEYGLGILQRHPKCSGLTICIATSPLKKTRKKVKIFAWSYCMDMQNYYSPQWQPVSRVSSNCEPLHVYKLQTIIPGSGHYREVAGKILQQCKWSSWLRKMRFTQWCWWQCGSSFMLEIACFEQLQRSVTSILIRSCDIKLQPI